MSQISELLENTKFENLISKFEVTGHKDVNSFRNVKLIEYLKNYVSDENDLIELSGIITKSIEKSNKKILKVFWPIMILVWILMGGLAVYFFFGNSESKSEGPVTLSKAKTIDQAKERIDWLITSFSSDYNSYCNLPKNSSTEAKFNSLRISLVELTLAETKCEQLNYSQQEVVGKYILEQLKQKQELYQLEETGMISCWK